MGGGGGDAGGAGGGGRGGVGGAAVGGGVRLPWGQGRVADGGLRRLRVAGAGRQVWRGSVRIRGRCPRWKR